MAIRADGDGHWATTLPVDLPDGTYRVTARARRDGHPRGPAVSQVMTWPSSEMAACRRLLPVSEPAGLALDFLSGTALRKGSNPYFGPWQDLPGLSFQRGSVGQYVDANGDYVEAAANVPRITHDPATGQRLGLLIEGAQSQYIQNNRMNGAGVGVRPTGWVAPSATAAGISVTCAGAGIEHGINYTDWDVSGTATSAGSLLLFCFGSATHIPAVAGQAWSIATFCSLAGGSTEGTDWSSGASGGLFIYAYSSAFGFLNGPVVPFTPSAGSLAARRIFNENWITPAGTAYVAQAIRCGILLGATLNMRLRVGWPCETLGAVAGSPVLLPGPSTRQADALVVPVSALPYSANQGTFLASAWTPASKMAPVTGLMQLDDVAANNRVTLGVSSDSDRRLFAHFRTPAGYSLLQTVGTPIPAGERVRAALTWRPDGTVAISLNGGAAIGFSGAVAPAVTRLSIGSGPALNAWGGPIQDATYIGRGVSDSDLRALTA